MKKYLSKLSTKSAAPYVFILPFLITFVVFFAYPLGSSIVMSFQEVLPGQTKFIGLDNYKNLLNPTFFTAVKNSLIYMGLTLVVLIPLPMFLAICLNSPHMPFKTFFKSTLFLPALSSVVVAGIIFRMMFGDLENSQMNQVLTFFNQSPIKWLRNPFTVQFTFVLLATWRWLGVNTLYFLSGLQNISKEVYEAADLDGATSFQKIIFVTIPMLRPILIYVLTISVYAGLAMFTESFMLFGGNKSPNDMGLTIIGYLYRAGIEQNQLGFASAIGIFMLVFAVVINLIQLKFSGFFSKEA